MKIKYTLPQTFYGLILMATLGFHTGCFNDSVQDSNVNVKIVSPGENQIFLAGEEIRYYAEIESDVSIHGYELFEKNIATGDSVLLANKHTHGKNVQVLHVRTASHSQKGQADIILKVLIDHDRLSKSFYRKIMYQ